MSTASIVKPSASHSSDPDARAKTVSTTTRNLVFTAGAAVILAIAAGGFAMAVGHYAEPHPSAPAAAAAKPETVACGYCNANGEPPFRWEIAKDAKPAEPMPTF